MIKKDYSDVSDIEFESFEFPWTIKEIDKCIKQKRVVGEVITYEEKVVGYMIYEKSEGIIYLLNMAVSPDFRRKGAGTTMINKLKKYLSKKKRDIHLVVRETNMPAQFFFASQGFRATGVERNSFEQIDEDGYTFEYHEIPSPVGSGKVIWE
jgi:ribosomal-protein-alanine N-acetyltransferase